MLDGRFHDELAIVLCSLLHSRHELGFVSDLRDADARAEIGGLHEPRIREGGFAFGSHRLGIVAPPLAQEHAVGRDLELPLPKQRFHGGLVHADGGAEHSRSHVGNVRELEQSLHGAVLTERSVQNREHHVERLACAVGTVIEPHQ